MSNLTPQHWIDNLSALTKAIETGDLTSLSVNHPINQFKTQDPTCQRIKSQVLILVNRPEPVLITGPSGTGKEILAKSLKGYNDFNPFIAVNCAALPDSLAVSILQGHIKGSFTGANDDRKGVFELAGNGIVFLDEIGDMPLPQQAILLRILQEKEVFPIGADKPRPITCRIVAATNRSLPSLIKQQEFRADLYARLMTFELTIPPFSARPDDARHIGRELGLLDTTPIDNDKLEIYGVRYLQSLVARQNANLL